MKPIKFRIKNYKSIKDSKECYFENSYTVLAGKNESGKTSVLEALRDFGEQAKISANAIPINDSNTEPEIIVWFSVAKDSLEEIYSDYGLVKASHVKEKNIIQVSKKFGTKDYEYSSDVNLLLFQDFDSYCEKIVCPVWEDLRKLLPVFADELNTKDFESWKDFINERLDESNNRIKQFTNGTEQWVGINQNHLAPLKKIVRFINSYEEKQDITDEVLSELTSQYMPSFILYSSFDDCFPDEILVDQIKENEFAQDLEEISNFNIENIINPDKQTQSNHQGKINSEFTEIFKKYWGQSQIKLQVEKDGEKVYFWIKENDISYKPSQRSKGQQWFLSFYIKIVARMKEDVPNVILIDEPGLFLHAKAQKDMLKTLEDQFEENIIIFSTHSPYLIDENKLNHIRLVEKEDNFTTIHSKTWAKIKDEETLTPILTAIGLGLGDGIENRRGKDNIICEGVEDVFYLRAFKSILNESSDLNFINGDGANKIHFISRILEAWQCNVRYLFDNDRAGIRAKNTLLKKEHIDEDKVLLISDVDNSATVDLLSKNDFKKYVLENEEAEVNISNSKYISDNKLEKALLARKFLNSAKDVKLDDESTKNIRFLFERLKL